MFNKEYWKIADDTKRRLFNTVRNFFKEKPVIDVSSNARQAIEYQKQITREARNLVLKEWKSIKEEYRNDSSFSKTRLSGYVYEVLFYLCTLDLSATFFEEDLYWMSSRKEFEEIMGEAPPHFEPLPLYDIISPLAYKTINRKRARTPQLRGDFILFYVEGPAGRRKVTPISIVDVKKSIFAYEKKKREGKWQAIAALRHGFVAQIAYPKKGIEEIFSIRDWEIKTICPDCGGLMDKVCRICPFCRKEAYPFTREDWEKL